VNGRPTGLGALAGVTAVAAAVLVGLGLAGLLGWLGLTDTPAVTLGLWLAGLGLLGGWRQDVTSDVAGGLQWSTWAAGAPLLVTAAAILAVWAFARRGQLRAVGAVAAVVGAAGAALLLVVASEQSTTVANEAGSVTTTEGLTVWWTGGLRPGTVTGCALLVGIVVLVQSVGRRWWASGRAVAFGLLVLPGLVVTLGLAAGAVWLTSAPAVGGALAALYPLVGTAILLAVGGAPSELGLTRISPEPYDLSTWSVGPAAVAGGILAVLLVAAVVGLVLRRRRHTGSAVAGITATAALALFLTWAMATTVDVPDSLGGLTRVATNPVLAAVVAAVMAAVALLVRGRARAAGAAARQASGSDDQREADSGERAA
jgi:hypothetical protein